MRSIVLLVTVAHLAGTARAQSAHDSDSGLLLPALQLSATTDDQGKLKASLPYLLPGKPGGWLAIAALRLQIASAKGVSTLFSSAGNETLPWETGLTLLAVDTQSDDSSPSVSEAKIRAYDQCFALCTEASCKFKPDATPTDKAILNRRELCPEGLAEYLRYEATLTGRRSVPRQRLSFGAAVGRQQFKYLTGTPGAGQTLASASTIETTTRGGALYSAAWALEGTHAGVVEARGVYTRGWNAASSVGHWCQPVGMVGSDPNSSVQQCKDLALGAPSQVASYTLAVDIGVVDSFAQTWRVSAGGFSTVGITNVADAFGAELPIYLNFTPGSTFTDYLGSYKGILRITPRISWAKDAAGHFPTTIVLTFEALAQTSIFSEVLDY